LQAIGFAPIPNASRLARVQVPAGLERGVARLSDFLLIVRNARRIVTKRRHILIIFDEVTTLLAMNERIDEIDRKILDILAADGRTPAVQIAEQVGLSRPAVAQRLERLERDRILLGTAAVVDPEALGLGITAFIAAQHSTPLDAKARRAFDELMDRSEILEIHTVAGDDCYLIKVRTGSISSLNDLVSSLAKPPLSLSTRTTIVMQTHCEKIGGITLGEKS
jgi:Lrp/AsnC family leucine-responsive transcriptional regulator